MINYNKLDEYRTEIKRQYEKETAEINELIQKEDPLEIICFIAALRYICSDGGRSTIEPSVLEYIVCMSLNQLHTNNVPEEKDVHNMLRIWQLGEEIVQNWTKYAYYERISEDDLIEDMQRKMFVASMKISYGVIRGYSWYRDIEKKRISKIFEGINQEVEQIIGFMPIEAWECVELYERIIEKRLIAFREETRDLVGISRANGVEFYKNMYQFNYKELLGVTMSDMVAENTEISHKSIENVLKFFSIDVQSLEHYEYQNIIDSSPYEDKPIIKYEDKFFIPNTDCILWKLRESIEEKIKITKLWSKYDKKNKAKYLEEESITLFKRLLPQCQIYSSLYYYPEGCQSGCELDAIALYDNIVILIEAKSGIYSKSARRGGLERLKKNISENIEKAFNQGNRTREYIRNSKEAVFYEKNNRNKEVLKIKGEDYKHFFVINTTLDYYAELGIDLYRLQEWGIYKGKEFPWTICISDLEVISDFIDFPNQFIYYIMMRHNMNHSLSKQNHVKLLYELDVFGMYKLENTEEYDKYWCEAIDEKVLLDIFEEDQIHNDTLTVQQCVTYDFSTYFYKYYAERYLHGNVVDIPKKIYNKRYLEMCRQLEEYKAFGYSDFIFRFLDIDLENQNILLDQIDKVCEMSRRDKRMHQITIKKMPNQFMSSTFGMVVYVGYLKDRVKITQLAYAAGTVQQGLTGIKDWITLVIYLDDDRHFINQFYYHFGNEESERIGNSIVNSIVNHIPIKKGEKVGRNDQCPCGSGKKYKVCCGCS